MGGLFLHFPRNGKWKVYVSSMHVIHTNRFPYGGFTFHSLGIETLAPICTLTLPNLGEPENNIIILGMFIRKVCPNRDLNPRLLAHRVVSIVTEPQRSSISEIMTFSYYSTWVFDRRGPPK